MNLSNSWLPFWYVSAGNPYMYSLIEIKREDWQGETVIVCPAQIPPEFNVFGLWWRPLKALRWDGP